MGKKDVSIIVTMQDLASRQMQKFGATVQTAESRVMSLGSSVKGLFAGGGAAGTMAMMAKTTYEWAMAVNDIEDITGMAGESASKLLYVGQSVRLTSEQIAGALGKMSRSASTAEEEIKRMGAEGKASTDIYSRFGIQILDNNGRMLAAEKIFRNILEVHRQLPNGIEKTNMEMAIFGRSGKDLNDILNISAQEFDRLIANAERAGLVISSETSQAWEDLRNKTKELELSFKGMQVQIGNVLLPTFIDAVDETTTMVQTFQSMSAETKTFIADLTKTAAEVGAVTIAVSGLQFVMGTFGLAVVNPWLGLAAAIGLATFELDKYLEKAKMLPSYSGNPIKAETVYDNGVPTKAYFKKVQVDDVVGELLRGTNAPRNQYAGYGWRRLSAEEEAAQRAYEEAVAQGQETGNPVYNEKERAARDRERAMQAIRDNYKTPPGPVINGSDAAQKKLDSMEELAASLEAKIMNLIGTTPAAAIAKLNEELQKAQDKIDEAARVGVDTSDVSAKLAEYRKTAIEKIQEDTLRAQKTLAAETMLINAQTAEDHKKVADAEYAATMVSLNKQKDEKWKNVADKDAAEAWYSAQVAAAVKKREQDYIDADRRIFENKLAHNTRLYELDGTSRTVIDQINRTALNERIAELQRLLAETQENTKERERLEQELADRKRQIWEINGRDLNTAAAEATRRLQEHQTDYAGIMVDSFYEISGSWEDHIKKMLDRTESFADGVKGIIHDMALEVQSMMIKMAMEQFVMQPLKNWWSGLLGGMFGGSGGASGSAPAGGWTPNLSGLAGKASGGPVTAGTLYRVNEPWAGGIEVFQPAVNGYILNPSQQKAQQQNQRPAQIIFNVTTPDANSFRRSQGQIYADANAMLARGRRNM